MVTGTLPWSSENQIELFRQIRQADIDLPVHLSPTLQELLAKMLQREPANRLTIEEVLEASWFPKRRSLLKTLGRAASDSPHRKASAAERTSGLSPIVASATKKLIVRPRRMTTDGQGLVGSPSFRLPGSAPGGSGLVGLSRTWD
jgi:serine/threonine protein kinase